MKKILGLDLGVSSIGWALIKEEDHKHEIIGMGSRIIPLSADDTNEFSSGNKISKNQSRTQKRTQRRGYDRYQQRRQRLTEELRKLNMQPDEVLIKLPQLTLWGIRSRSVTEKISLVEFGRVLYHLNQKRGYKSSRSEANADKKDTEYVAEVNSRYEHLKQDGLTIGQKFFNELSQNQYYRIKQQVFPREAYIEEFNAICNQQQKHYPEIITDEWIRKLRNEIIYYQRKLKSQKGLVSVCEFEGFYTKSKRNKDIFVGPKVAPRSSPLFQVCKIWETINTITLKNKNGEEYLIPLEKKLELFTYLDNHEKLTQAELFKILQLKKEDGWYSNKQIAKGLQGNITKSQIMHAVEGLEFNSSLLQFNLEIEEKQDEAFLVDKKTGEILESAVKKTIAPAFEKQPFYQIWHIIYSIDDLEECTNTLINRFSLTVEVARKVASLDFKKSAFGNKSSKAIRKILPYLMDGYVYSDACSFGGYNHSKSLTNEELLSKQLLNKIPNLAKNSLRQPVVEKIINQLINIVNEIIDEKRGWVTRDERQSNKFEIRIELARELKQSREERNETYANLNKRERENEIIRKRLYEEYGLRGTRNNVIKWWLFHEINNDESKANATCVYCGKPFGITAALNGTDVDVEHIIPKSLLFDDSQSNKTLTHRSCNEAKGNKTAYDYMHGKTTEEFQQYVDRVDNLFKSKIIGKAKRDKLLMTETKIPKDFIERQLRQTQYISRKSKEILEQVCFNVWSTSGSITEYLRRIWGWDDVLMNLQLPKYRELGLTEWVEWETNDGQVHKKEIIKGWTKRNDHRHHAIDALTIACTQQGFVQRINSLNAKHTRDEMFTEVSKQNKNFRDSLRLLDAYLILQKQFTTAQVEEIANRILISFKSGKKVATLSSRKIKRGGKKEVIQTGIITPRGALSEESVYGKIKMLDKNKSVKYLFENPQLIFKPHIKELVETRLAEHKNDAKEALKSLKKEPVYLDAEKKVLLEYGTCFKNEYVIKYPLTSIKAKDVQYIIDEKIKATVKARLEKYGNKEKEAFKEPLYYNEESKNQIRTVRMLTGLSSVEAVKKDEKGTEIGFVKPGNNHHIAIYTDEKGNATEHICTFWHAVERKQYEIPVIITNTREVWDKVLANKDDYPESFLAKLPDQNWSFDLSLQQNEMFVLGMKQEEFERALKENRKDLINEYLYRVQKIGLSDYWFRKHTETQLIDTDDSKSSKRYFRYKSINAFKKSNPIKIRTNIIGEII